MTDKRYVKTFTKDEYRYARNYYNKLVQDTRENPNTNILQVSISYEMVSRVLHDWRAMSDITIVVIYK